jgi:tetratricopeptide (TPR) repeat protein
MLSSLCDPSKAAPPLERELAKPRTAEASLLRSMLVDWVRGFELLRGNLREAGGLATEGRCDPLVDAQIAFYQGEWRLAESMLVLALEQARKGERRMRVCRFSDMLARVRRALALHMTAEQILHENLAICIDAPHVPLELRTRHELALLYAETQRPEQAHPHLERCREVIAAGEDWRGLVGHVERAEGAVAAAEARFEVADQQFASAVEIFRRYQVPFEEAETLHYWGRALLAAGDSGRALEKLDAAMEIYQQHGAGRRWLETVQADKLWARSAGASIKREPPAARVCQLGDRPENGGQASELKTQRLKEFSSNRVSTGPFPGRAPRCG